MFSAEDALPCLRGRNQGTHDVMGPHTAAFRLSVLHCEPPSMLIPVITAAIRQLPNSVMSQMFCEHKSYHS